MALASGGFMTSRLPLRRLQRSALVGFAATMIDLAALAFGVEILHLDPRAVTPVALGIGVLVQFFGNKVLAFQDRSPAWARQAMLFLAVEAAGYTANVALFALLSTLAPVRIPYALLRVVIGSAVYFGICLPLWSKIFRARGDEGEEAHA